MSIILGSGLERVLGRERLAAPKPSAVILCRAVTLVRLRGLLG
ncbi:hypothetical protein [Mycobacteroides abscessus]|nr:hypothetical protein [Mycobacteroides abscessus]